MRVTFRRINDALRELGLKEQLVRGRGYFYFIEGDAAGWYSSSVYTYHLNDYTLDEWIAERNRLAHERGGYR